MKYKSVNFVCYALFQVSVKSIVFLIRWGKVYFLLPSMLLGTRKLLICSFNVFCPQVSQCTTRCLTTTSSSIPPMDLQEGTLRWHMVRGNPTHSSRTTCPHPPVSMVTHSRERMVATLDRGAKVHLHPTRLGTGTTKEGNLVLHPLSPRPVLVERGMEDTIKASILEAISSRGLGRSAYIELGEGGSNSPHHPSFVSYLSIQSLKVDGITGRKASCEVD